MSLAREERELGKEEKKVRRIKNIPLGEMTRQLLLEAIPTAAAKWPREPK